MRPIYWLISLLFFTAPAHCRTVVFVDSANRSIVSRVLEKTFLMQYEEALTTVDTLEIQVPGHAICPLLRAGVLYCRMLDYEDQLDMKEFEQYFDQAWESSEDLKKDGETAEADLYFGILLGYKALLYQRDGKWWPAVRTGLRAVGHLKHCISVDSSYADAYLGLGTYKYWSSKATDFINWLPLIPDQKTEGIALMRRATEEGLFGREISRSTLAWTLIDAGRPVEAIELSKEGLKLYPGSHFYLWSLANGYFRIGRLRDAIQVYEQLYYSVHSQQRNNYYNELGICKQLGLIYLSLRKPEQALEWINRGLSLPADDEIRSRRKKSLQKLVEMKDQAQKQIEEKK